MQDKNSSSAATRLRHNSPTTDKSLKMSNYVQQITSFEPPTPCSFHYHDSVGYICIDCRYKCLCGTCLQEGSHKTHHVKNIEKGSKIVDRVLNQSLIRLRSKSDLLASLKDYIKIRKSQIFIQYSEYEQTININFESLAIALAEKKREMLESIIIQHQQITKKIEDLISNINQQSLLTLQMINTVQQKIDKLKQYPTSLCLFFQNKNILIQNMVQDAAKNFQFFKNQVPDMKWEVQLTIFDTLKNYINSLKLETNSNSIFLFCNFLKDSKQNIKLNEHKLSKAKSNYIIGSRTPKNCEIQKVFHGQVKSPNSGLSRKSKGKLNSMPGSPEKQKSAKKKSPIKSKQQQMNKKFKRNKK